MTRPIKLRAALIAVAMGSSGAPACADAFGYYYMDLGSRDKDIACEDVKRVIRQFQAVAESTAECYWLTESQPERSYIDGAKVTIQLREVRGSIYEMAFNLPKTTTLSAFYAFMRKGNVTTLEDIGVTRGTRVPAVAAAVKERDEAAAERRAAGGPCEWVRFTGFASPFVQDLQTLENSPNPKRLVAENPLQCESRTWGSTYNRNHTVQCRGIRYFTAAKARVMASRDGVSRVLTLIEFQGGAAEAVSLAIRTKDATCLTGKDARP